MKNHGVGEPKRNELFALSAVHAMNGKFNAGHNEGSQSCLYLSPCGEIDLTRHIRYLRKYVRQQDNIREFRNYKSKQIKIINRIGA